MVVFKAYAKHDLINITTKQHLENEIQVLQVGGCGSPEGNCSLGHVRRGGKSAPSWGCATQGVPLHQLGQTLTSGLLQLPVAIASGILLV